MSDGIRLSEQVIGCAQHVSRELGAGFLESVYENALALELEEKGIVFARQLELDVYYKKQLIGLFKADLLVENRLLIEIKAVPKFNDRHRAQLLNYLRATELNVGLLLNFGMPRLGIQRVVWKYNEANRI